ncbi:MAG: hypothetical protein IJV06_09405 [Bacteroidaceae bacterium]|nr:hypothetical protein [Bacteroidaceae bacterium]
MKKFLRSLVLVAASAIPALSWAATNYGIYVDGTMINSDNCKNLKTTHMTSGSVSYDYSSNTLTLNSVYLNVNNESYFINATSSVKNGLKIVVNGYNDIGECNGIAIALQKPTGSSASQPSYYFQGDGVLSLYKGEIETFDGVGVSFGKSGVSDTDGGLDIYAGYIRSRSSAGGYVWISDANLHLTGSTYGNGTFGGFTSVYMYNGIAAYSEDGKTKYSYGGASVLRDPSGNMVTGPAYIGYEKYGLNLCGKEVTAGNYNRLNMKSLISFDGTYSYSPSSKTLYMTNATLNNNVTSYKQQHYCITNSIDGLKVNVTGTCKISENMGRAAVYSTGDITFQGTGTLSLRSSAGKAIQMDATEKTIGFSNLTAAVEYGGIHCNNGTVSLSNCTLNVNEGGSRGGGIQNMGKLRCYNTAVTTSGVYYDDRDNKFYKVSSSSSYTYTGELNFKPVKNYYGIQVCGVELTEHNYNNVAAPYIEKGSIVYNPSTNELTLTNLTIDTKERGAFPAIMIHSAAQSGMKVLLVGNNVIKKTNGAAFVFQKPNSTTNVSNPHYYIDGTGSLTLEESGFLCFDFCNLCFGSGVSGGQGLGGCTIDAQYLQARTAGQGRVWFTDCMMTLHGYGSAGTFMNFDNVFTSSHCVIRTPENGSYNSSSYYLADASGNKVTGEVYIGWEKYGLKICGIEVNEINKDNIQDRINSTPCIYKYGASSVTAPAYGSVKYDPSTGTLTLNSVELNDVLNSANITACCIENTGKELHINCTGQSRIAMSRGNRATIYSTKSLDFRGSAPLEVFASTKNAIEIDGKGQTVKFNNCNTVVDGRGGNAINATRENQYGLNVQRANVTVKGSVHGIAYYNLANAAIATEKVFVQPANSQYLGCFREFGRGEYFGETVFKPVTTNYGILVSGHELNDVNANNFYFDDITTGSVSYDVSSNTVTIDNLTANCMYMTTLNGEVVERHSNGMNITSRATDNVKVNLVGNSVLNDINGVGISVYKNTTFKGSGTLDVGDKSIAGSDGCNITVAESCTLNAGRMYGSEGVVHVTNQASLNLSGSNNTSYPTVYGFERFTANGYASGQVNTDVITPNGGWYDEEHKQFVTHVIDGRNPVIGPVKIAPVMFRDLIVEAIAVTDANKDDIFRDLPHEGTMSLVGDSLCDMLCLDNFKVTGSTSTYGIQRFKTGRMFNVELKGENELKNFNYFHFGDGTSIKGGGSLTTDAYTIYVYGSLFVEDCSISGVRWIECPDSASYTSLNVNKANLSLSGNYTGRSTIDGFKYFDLSNAVVTTPASYMYDSSDRQMEVNGSVYSGAVEILATENYDIAIGNMQITSLNKDDVFGDGTVSLSIDPDAQVYQLTLKNASLSDRLYIGWNCAADVIVCLEGQSSIKTEREDCIYSTRSIAFRSEDGTGKLDLLSKDGSGIFTMGDIILNGCDLTIQAGNYGIYNYGQAETAAGTAGSCAIGLLQGEGDTRLTIDTETRNGGDNLWNVGLYAEGPMEILRPVDANYNEMDGSICDVTGAPISGTVLEVLVKGASPAISVQDITDLIDQYLEGSPNITVQTITDLIDRYLNQGN